jgi:branched-chain amino acid transport system substrate-binding protein
VATGVPIVMGSLQTLSGPLGTAAAGDPTLISNWVQDVNSHGGINGHPVKISVADDAGDVTKAQSLLQGFVSAKVVGLVGDTNPDTADATGSYLLQHKIPVIGGATNTPVWFSNPMFFPSGSNYAAYLYGSALEVKKAGISKLALAYCDETNCRQYAGVTSGYARKLGIDVVLKQQHSLTQTDFTADCQALKDSGATGVSTVSTPDILARFTTACQSLGYNPDWFAVSSQQLTSFDQNPNWTQHGAQNNFPWFQTAGSPQLEKFGQLSQDIPAAQHTVGLASVFVALEMFKAAATAGIPRDGTPTTADLLKGLYTFKNNTVGGLTVPLTFAAGQPAHAGFCWFGTLLKGGKWTAPSLKPVCVTSSG